MTATSTNMQIETVTCKDCRWLVNVNYLDQHKANCDRGFVPVICNYCNWTVQRNMFGKHAAEDCAGRVVRCEKCGDQFARCELKTHQCDVVKFPYIRHGEPLPMPAPVPNRMKYIMEESLNDAMESVRQPIMQVDSIRRPRVGPMHRCINGGNATYEFCVASASGHCGSCNSYVGKPFFKAWNAEIVEDSDMDIGSDSE